MTTSAPPRRHKFLRLVGGGIGTAESNPRRSAPSFALLAPNPPKLRSRPASLPGTAGIVLYCDRSRLLRRTDPFSRQIMIGQGAFLELLDLTVGPQGYATKSVVFPGGEFVRLADARPVAPIRRVPRAGVAADPLFAHVLARRRYEAQSDPGRAVPPASLAAVAACGPLPGVATGLNTDPARLPALPKIAAEARRVECATPRTLKERSDVLGIGDREIAKRRGIGATAPTARATAGSGAAFPESRWPHRALRRQHGLRRGDFPKHPPWLRCPRTRKDSDRRLRTAPVYGRATLQPRGSRQDPPRVRRQTDRRHALGRPSTHRRSPRGPRHRAVRLARGPEAAVRFFPRRGPGREYRGLIPGRPLCARRPPSENDRFRPQGLPFIGPFQSVDPVERPFNGFCSSAGNLRPSIGFLKRSCLMSHITIAKPRIWHF
jgi:hypothetical protein